MTSVTRWMTRATFAGLAIAGMVASSACAQGTLYKAPNGTFDVKVPAGWTTDWDEAAAQLTLRHGSMQAIVGGLSLPTEKPAYMQTFLEATRQEMTNSCKGSEDKPRGPARLSGLAASTFLIVCPNAPPSVAGGSFTRTQAGVVLWFIEMSQVRSYADDVQTLDAIGATVHATGTPALTPRALSEDERVEQVSRACVVGAFASAAACAAHVSLAHAPVETTGHLQTSVGPRFSDADGQFSVAVPPGWTASLKDKNGIRGIELRRGEDWVALMIAPDGAPTTRDVVLHFEAGFSAQGGPKPPLGPLGIVELTGNGLEIDYDRFTSKNDDGLQVNSMVAGVARQGRPGPRVLMFSSIGGDHESVSLQVVNSVRITP